MNILLKLSFLISALLISTTYSAQVNVTKIIELSIDSSINPATHNYLKTNIKKASIKDGELMLIKMNTPGGLVSTTKDIIDLIAKSKAPIIIWITPEGASATSAGAIIASSAHILIASKGASIGAATPIDTGGDIKQTDVRNKAVNALSSMVSSLAKARGRNAKAFTEMITEAKSFDTEDALKLNILDSQVSSFSQLTTYLNGHEFKFNGKELRLAVDKDVKVESIDMDYGQLLLNIFASPSTAYILFILGAALLYFEFQAPGGFIAGSLGAVCLILAAIGFQVLPLNFGALGLIALSFILFVMEAFVTSYGLITVAGLISFISGSLFLYRTHDSFLDTQYALIVSAVFAIAGYLFIVGKIMFNDRNRKRVYFTFKNKSGTISKFLEKTEDGYRYQIKSEGEIWNAISEKELELNSKVKIIKENKTKMLLTIKEY